MLGIVSTSPAIVFDDDAITFGKTAGTNFDPLKPYVALAGRVPAKVSAENGPIAPGDPITSSSTPGVAMKATQTGRIVGVTLEPFRCPDPRHQCRGTIMVFVNPTWYVAPVGKLHIEYAAESPLGTFFGEIGATIKNGLLVIRELAVGTLTVDQMQVRDRLTGDIYCTWIEAGEWRKSKGAWLAN